MKNGEIEFIDGFGVKKLTIIRAKIEERDAENVTSLKKGFNSLYPDQLGSINVQIKVIIAPVIIEKIAP